MSSQTSFKDLVRKVLEENEKAHGEPMSAKEIADNLGPGTKVQSVNVAMRWLYQADQVSPSFDTKKVRTNYGSYTKPVFGSYRYRLKAQAST